MKIVGLRFWTRALGTLAISALCFAPATVFADHHEGKKSCPHATESGCAGKKDKADGSCSKKECENNCTCDKGKSCEGKSKDSHAGKAHEHHKEDKKAE
jgi:hypothetical protein